MTKQAISTKIESLLQNGNLAKMQQTLANHEEQEFPIGGIVFLNSPKPA